MQCASLTMLWGWTPGFYGWEMFSCFAQDFNASVFSCICKRFIGKGKSRGLSWP